MSTGTDSTLTEAIAIRERTTPDRARQLREEMERRRPARYPGWTREQCDEWNTYFAKPSLVRPPYTEQEIADWEEIFYGVTCCICAKCKARARK